MRNYGPAFALIGLLLAFGAGTALGAGDAAKGKKAYLTTCTACHNADPSQDGALGPALKGSSRALVEARVMRAEYPKGYKPKRATAIMPPYPYLKDQIDHLAAFLK